jgi:AcrR family transcriptional regulator
VSGRLPQTLRADAQDNRERILAAAREAFAAEGLDVPMREIARRAGVAPATVYRRFPTKQLLATAAFEEQMAACRAIVDAGLAAADPWAGFCFVIDRICELHARNRGFTAAFTSRFPSAIDVAADRRATLTAMAELTRRAKATGRLRRDFALDDLVLMLTAQRGIAAATTDARVAASRRYAQLAIRAFQAAPAA